MSRCFCLQDTRVKELKDGISKKSKERKYSTGYI